MHCPNCGTRTSIEQRYCRSCGLALEKVAEYLGEQVPAKLDESLRAQKQRFERLGQVMLGIFGLGILGAILYGIVYKAMIVQGRLFEGLVVLGFLGLIACGILAAYFFAVSNSVKAAASKRQSESLKGLSGDETTRELLTEGNMEPLTSITERTTELLLAQKKRVREDGSKEPNA